MMTREKVCGSLEKLMMRVISAADEKTVTCEMGALSLHTNSNVLALSLSNAIISNDVSIKVSDVAPPVSVFLFPPFFFLALGSVVLPGDAILPPLSLSLSASRPLSLAFVML